MPEKDINKLYYDEFCTLMLYSDHIDQLVDWERNADHTLPGNESSKISSLCFRNVFNLPQFSLEKNFPKFIEYERGRELEVFGI